MKKRIVTSIDKLTPDVLEAIYKKYPDGWVNHIKRIDKPNGEFFHAFTIDMPDISYLVKVNVKIDSKSDLEKEEEKAEAEHAESYTHEESEESSSEPADEPANHDDEF